MTTSSDAVSTYQVVYLNMAEEPKPSKGYDARASSNDSFPETTRMAIEFQKSQWATGSVYEDPFYVVPEGTANEIPGTLLKVEAEVNTLKFSIPPATALSRIMFQSKSLNGSSVPVSGIILWPYLPRKLVDGYPIVAWSHGASGITPNCAPSHMKNLWQHFQAPYQLALQGYVVVATDYAGLGVSKDEKGSKIVHEHLFCPSQANDVLFCVQAAQAAFSELSKHFVVIGHSQGGGSAWAAAQRQAITPVHGYLGAIALAPVTSIEDESDTCLNIIGLHMIPGIASAFPYFNPEDVLTPEGNRYLDFVLETEPWPSVTANLVEGIQLLKPDWIKNSAVQTFLRLAKNGGKKVDGPLLVIHGESDQVLDVKVTTNAVNKTLKLFPSSEIEYVRIPGVLHVPTVTASQQLWMDWIADRFAGLTVKQNQRLDFTPARPIKSYQPDMNWFIESATQFYHTPLN